MRYSIGLVVVRRMLGEMRAKYLIIELRAVRSCLEKCEVFDRVGSCKENVRRNARYLIEVESCKEFVRGCPRYSIELRVVRSLLGDM